MCQNFILFEFFPLKLILSKTYSELMGCTKIGEGPDLAFGPQFAEPWLTRYLQGCSVLIVH